VDCYATVFRTESDKEMSHDFTSRLRVAFVGSITHQTADDHLGLFEVSECNLSRFRNRNVLKLREKYICMHLIASVR